MYQSNIPIIGEQKSNHIKLKPSVKRRALTPGKTRFVAFGLMWLVTAVNPKQDTMTCRVTGTLGDVVPKGSTVVIPKAGVE